MGIQESERLKKIGKATARAINAAAAWAGERVEDAAMWPVNLLRDLPVRTGRLLTTLGMGVWGALRLLPGGVRALRADGWDGLMAWAKSGLVRGAAWAGTLIMQVLDLLGLPELFSLLWRIVTRVTPLTGDEIATAAAVLGSTALRYGDVRVARGGILRPIFKLNSGRAFTTFHTVNFPDDGRLDVLIHELVHVFQHERLGGIYLGECIYAQATGGYDYGGPDGLRRAREAGKRYHDFNREQQAQMVQDYYLHQRYGEDVSAYEPFIAEMRAGEL